MAPKQQVELYTPKYFALCGVGGILSCGLTHAATTPVDLVKCNAQTQPNVYNKGMFGNMGLIRQKLGPTGLVRGWAPTLVGYSLQGLGKFGLYEIFKYKYAQMVGAENAYKYQSILYMCASASAEFFADIMLCPFEATKVRVQTDLGYARGLSDGMPKILKNEGWNGLFKGLGPLWARQIPYTIIKFVALEKIVNVIYGRLPGNKEDYNKMQQLGVTFVAGYSAGVICGAVSHPADTMVSKLNFMKTEGSMLSNVGKIYGEIGFGGLWKGFGPRVFMIGTLTALQWFIYDTFKVQMGFPTTGGGGGKKEEK